MRACVRACLRVFAYGMAHVCSSSERMSPMQHIDYSHMTAAWLFLLLLRASCPALELWNCVFNQLHPICVEISIRQLPSIQNKHAHVAREFIAGFVSSKPNFCEPHFFVF